VVLGHTVGRGREGRGRRDRVVAVVVVRFRAFFEAKGRIPVTAEGREGGRKREGGRGRERNREACEFLCERTKEGIMQMEKVGKRLIPLYLETNTDTHTHTHTRTHTHILSPSLLPSPYTHTNPINKQNKFTPILGR